MIYLPMTSRRNITRTQIGGFKYLAILINFDISLTFQRIGENLIGTRGLYAFTELLKTGKPLHTLDISGEYRLPTFSRIFEHYIFFLKNTSILKTLFMLFSFLSLVHMHNVHPGANIHPGCTFAPGVYFGHVNCVL